VQIEERDRWLDARQSPLVLVAPRDQRELLDSIRATRSARELVLGQKWLGLLITPREAH
jgi:hypothetical protein